MKVALDDESKKMFSDIITLLEDIKYNLILLNKETKAIKSNHMNYTNDVIGGDKDGFVER
jgi:hypothetical protein